MTQTRSYDISIPRAECMIESLRAFGYDLPTAIADLIDNSISACAKNIWITFEWDGPASTISVQDDGNGMDEQQLTAAMRPGSRSPLEERDPKDLGRFGLGLKTASFSQCRSVTVVSKRSKTIAARCWDLDYVRSSGEWRLLKGDELVSPSLQASLGRANSGTIVLWNKLDRIVAGATAGDIPAHKRFLDAMDRVKNHLAMVFHRFLGRNGTKVWINTREVKPWDPFLLSEPGLQELGKEVLPYQSSFVEIQPYVLPHHSKLDKSIHQMAAGPKGWNAQQGFYIYRNRRLLVAGDWLQLGFQKEEHFKLARIQVDLTNQMDADWEIDVKKCRAHPPGPLRTDLYRIASATRARASEVYRHRGRVVAREAGAHAFVWLKKVKNGKTSYRINRDHPLVAHLLLQQANASSTELSALLRLVEETVPVPYVVINNAESPDSMALPFEGAPPKELVALLTLLIKAFSSQGLRGPALVQRIGALEPFNSYPQLVAAHCDS